MVKRSIVRASSDGSRRAFLRKASTVMVGGAAVAGARSARAQTANTEAFELNSEFFNQIRAHENAHLATLQQLLGSNARPEPTFSGLEIRKARDFSEISQLLENTESGAYLGAAPYIYDKTTLATAGSIALIEGRHAGWLNSLFADPITANATDLTMDQNFETPLSADQVAAAASVFITSLNGGLALTYSTTPSPTNDIAILNFALALEYLGSTFYNTNVPNFFPTSDNS